MASFTSASETKLGCKSVGPKANKITGKWQISFSLDKGEAVQIQKSLKPCVPDAELSSGTCTQKGDLSHCCFSEINGSVGGSREKCQLKA